MSRQSERAPRRWTEGGAQDALSRRAAALFNVAPPVPLGPVRREQIARRLAAGAAHSHAGLPLLAKATGVVATAAGLAVGIVHYTSSPAPHLPKEGVIVSPARPAPMDAMPEPKPASARTTPPWIIPTPSSRSRWTSRPTKLASSTPSHPVSVSTSVRDAEGSAPIPSVSPPAIAPSVTPAPPPTSTTPGPVPPESAIYPRAVSKPETYVPPPPTRTSAPARPPAPSEPRLLADALASLHARADAKGALALLAEYRRRFPSGALRSEARVAEIEALLSLDRRADALRVLDGLDVERIQVGASLSVLRAELRAQAGRCADAIADFDRCAAGNCDSESHERALFGRASCLRRLGQMAAARADLERYLVRFPQGWRSEAVRRALAK